MPTNLPPEYFEAEERHRAAGSIAEQISTLEQLISTVPKHKGTDKLRADLRRKLSKLKAQSQSKKGAAKHDSAYHIDREGAGQVVLVGLANVGKSALLAALTNATPEVAAYPYTTWTPTPGMMLVENVQVQLIDTPPLNRDFIEPEQLNLIRRADLVLLVIDLQSYPLEQFEEAVDILLENRIVAAHLREGYQGERPLFVPFLMVVNKTDDEGGDDDVEVLRELLGSEWPLVAVSAANGRNLDDLRWAVFDLLGIMRVYSKPPGKQPDRGAPFVLKTGSTVEEFAGKVHGDFRETLKSARVWGSGVHDGQMVGRDHVLSDEDVVELRV
jgi:small GTP-binding protein